MDFWNGALVVTLVSAALAVVGYGIVRLIDRDRSGLLMSIRDPVQAVPLVGPSPRLDSRPVYCEAVRFVLVLSHNQAGRKPVRVTRLRIGAEPVDKASGAQAIPDYAVDVLSLAPHGILRVREYRFALSAGGVEGRYIKSRDAGGAVSVDPDNIFHAVDGVDALGLPPDGDDAHFQSESVVEANAPGLYRVRFEAVYDVGGTRRDGCTEWLYLCRHT